MAKRREEDNLLDRKMNIEIGTVVIDEESKEWKVYRTIFRHFTIERGGLCRISFCSSNLEELSEKLVEQNFRVK
jgi:hypothetical protein